MTQDEIVKEELTKKIDMVVKAAMVIPGLTEAAELRYLAQLCQATIYPGRIVELGTFNGRSTAVLCLMTNWRRVISIDNYKMMHHGPNALRIAQTALSVIDQKPELIEGDTRDVPDTFRYSYKEISLLLIDSHHHPDTFHAEMKAYQPYLVPGSLVVVHDIGHTEEYPGFTEAVLEYMQPPKWTDEGKVGSMQAWRLEEF